METILLSVLSTVFIVGGGLLGVWWVRRPDKKGRLEAKEKEKEAERRRFLMEDEIIGHEGIPGVPDKDGLSARAGRIELAVSGLQRELHPNGGSSLADKINQTARDTAATRILAEEARAKAQEAADRAAETAEHLAISDPVTGAEFRAHAQRFKDHMDQDTKNFQSLHNEITVLSGAARGAREGHGNDA